MEQSACRNAMARQLERTPQSQPQLQGCPQGLLPLTCPAQGSATACVPHNGPLRETNWKRSVGWSRAKASIGRATLRVHDLRHTAASIWLGGGADPKVVQRVLGHASAAMTMDLYGHLIDRNLWDTAQRLGGTLGARQPPPEEDGMGGSASTTR
jgi:integrase